MKREPYVDAEYRVLGEGRWGPFRRWAAEMSWKYQAKLLGEEVAGSVWWLKLLYIAWVGGGVVAVYFFARWFNAFLWRAIG